MRQLLEDLKGLVQVMPLLGENNIIQCDLYSQGQRSESIKCRWRLWILRKNAGKAILDFVMAYQLMLDNTIFNKRDEHLVTYKSGL